LIPQRKPGTQDKKIKFQENNPEIPNEFVFQAPRPAPRVKAGRIIVGVAAGNPPSAGHRAWDPAVACLRLGNTSVQGEELRPGADGRPRRSFVKAVLVP
jgi:hypothetical protein